MHKQSLLHSLLIGGQTDVEFMAILKNAANVEGSVLARNDLHFSGLGMKSIDEVVEYQWRHTF